MDQGVHVFRFWIDAGSIDHALDSVERKALVCNEQPYVLPCFPPSGGDKRRSISFWSLDDDAIVASCAKKAQNDGGLVIRLFEPTGKHRKATLKLGVLDKNFKLEFSPFEIKTLKISKKGVVTEADLLEKKLTRVKRK
jgi:alpha-mannosidase